MKAKANHNGYFHGMENKIRETGHQQLRGMGLLVSFHPPINIQLIGTETYLYGLRY